MSSSEGARKEAPSLMFFSYRRLEVGFRGYPRSPARSKYCTMKNVVFSNLSPWIIDRISFAALALYSGLQFPAWLWFLSLCKCVNLHNKDWVYVCYPPFVHGSLPNHCWSLSRLISLHQWLSFLKFLRECSRAFNHTARATASALPITKLLPIAC